MARQGWVSQPYNTRRWCSCRAIGLFLSSLEARDGGSLEGSRKTTHDVTSILSCLIARTNAAHTTWHISGERLRELLGALARGGVPARWLAPYAAPPRELALEVWTT